MHTGGPRLRCPSFKIVLAYESFFYEQASDCILKLTLKSTDWSDKEFESCLFLNTDNYTYDLIVE